LLLEQRRSNCPPLDDIQGRTSSSQNLPGEKVHETLREHFYGFQPLLYFVVAGEEEEFQVQHPVNEPLVRVAFKRLQTVQTEVIEQQ